MTGAHQLDGRAGRVRTAGGWGLCVRKRHARGSNRGYGRGWAVIQASTLHREQNRGENPATAGAGVVFRGFRGVFYLLPDTPPVLL